MAKSLKFVTLRGICSMHRANGDIFNTVWMIAKKTVLRHVLVWLIFISYELSCLKFTVGIHSPFWNFVIYYTLNILLFYVNAHIILDFAFFKTSKPYVISITLIIFELALYIYCKSLIDNLLTSSTNTLAYQSQYLQQYLLTNIWRGIFFIGFSIAYWSMMSFVRVRDRNHQIETEQLKTMAKSLELQNKYMSVENAYLQNQISPHLLFNSLNFIHNKVYKESAEAGDSVARLSELMRYSLVSADDKRTVFLSQEVKQLENLIALCQMRFRNEFFLKFKKSGKIATIQIMPLILITLVENMMKHGDLGDKKMPAHICLEVSENRLLFTTFNKKRNTNLYPKNGVGLKNVEKRLGNFYHTRYTFLKSDGEVTFTTNLTIQL
jgi:two-component system LytT family sensor kinase